MDRFSRRTVKVTREHNEECRRLLGLMGIPFVVVRRISPILTSTSSSCLSTQAPSEAEAQCAELARGGKVYAAGSEDMDTLTFGAPILYRHLTFSEARKTPISEINLQKALEGLEMNMSQVRQLPFAPLRIYNTGLMLWGPSLQSCVSCSGAITSSP